jgi:hypothetical protein
VPADSRHALSGHPTGARRHLTGYVCHTGGVGDVSLHRSARVTLLGWPISSTGESDMNQIVYDMCRQAANEGKTITYSDVGSRIGLDMANEGERFKLGQLLDEVSRHEHAQGRPLLSVVVVHADGDTRPGDGFFVLARELGKFAGGDKDEFFFAELESTYAAWKR